MNKVARLGIKHPSRAIHYNSLIVLGCTGISTASHNGSERDNEPQMKTFAVTAFSAGTVIVFSVSEEVIVVIFLPANAPFSS